MIWSCMYSPKTGRVFSVIKTNTNRGASTAVDNFEDGEKLTDRIRGIIAKAPANFNPIGGTYGKFDRIRVKQVFSNGTVEVEYGKE